MRKSKQVKELEKMLDEIEKEYGAAVFKQMYSDLIQNLASFESFTSAYVLDRITDDLKIMLPKRG